LLCPSPGKADRQIPNLKALPFGTMAAGTAQGKRRSKREPRTVSSSGGSCLISLGQGKGGIRGGSLPMNPAERIDHGDFFRDLPLDKSSLIFDRKKLWDTGWNKD